MVRLLMVFIALLSSGCIKRYYPYEQNVPATGTHGWVDSRNGLVLREGPGLNYGKVESIPHGAEVIIVKDVGRDFTISGKSGRWNKLIYNGKEGYAFSGFLSENPTAVGTAGKEGEVEEVKEITPPKNKKADFPKPKGAYGFAYTSNDDVRLVRMSQADFENEKNRIRKTFLNEKEEFLKIPGPKRESETEREYIQRAFAAKEKFLKAVREFEFGFLEKTYSIYDARLDMGRYHEEISKFEHIGTTISIPWQREIITVPGIDLGEHGFSNGKRAWVHIPGLVARRIQEEAGDILVRIDFSYTESVYDVVSWRSRAFVLPKYLLLYNKFTGEPYYECKASHYIENSTDFAAPLKVSGKIVYENFY